MAKQMKLFELTSEGQPQRLTFYPSIAKLNRACYSCDRCSLSQNRRQVSVGRGQPQPNLVVVGEAPGRLEDKTGQPFVGESGQFFFKMLRAVQLEGSVYLTNAVRCRPPHNCQPTAEEIKACRPYLIDELRLIEPKIIICAGATAVTALTGKKSSISSLRGKWLDWEGIAVMPIFHPAYLLRNPSLKKGSFKWLTWQDLIAVKLKLEQL